jgi:hypothetical protein
MAISTAGAVLGATAIGGITSLLSGIIGSEAASSAASIQEKAALADIALQKEGLDYTKSVTERGRTDSLPWLEAGRNALDQYMVEMGLPPLTSARAQAGPAAPVPQSGGTPTPATPTPGRGPDPAQPATQPTGRGPATQVVGDKTYYWDDAGKVYVDQYGNVLTDNAGQGAAAGAAGNAGIAGGAGTVTTPSGIHSVGPVTQQRPQSPSLAPPPTTINPAASTSAPAPGAGFRETPGYRFALEEGKKGVLNSLASLGMKNSGAALKALSRYHIGQADQEYGNYLTRLSNLATGGQQQTQNTNALSLSGANSVASGLSRIGQAEVDAGAIRGSSFTGPANAWINSFNNIGNIGGNALGWLRQPAGA